MEGSQGVQSTWLDSSRCITRLIIFSFTQGTLPSVVEEVYKSEKPETIKLWGVSIDPKGTPDARASVILMKFLRAR